MTTAIVFIPMLIVAAVAAIALVAAVRARSAARLIADRCDVLERYLRTTLRRLSSQVVDAERRLEALREAS